MTKSSQGTGTATATQTVGVYRPSTGWFYYRNSNTTGVADGSLYVGRGFTVLTASGIDPKSITGDPFKPVEPESTAPTPRPRRLRLALRFRRVVWCRWLGLLRLRRVRCRVRLMCLSRVW